MIVDIEPRRLEVRPGFAQQFVVTITNTGDVIGGFALRVLGADPGWVDAPTEPFSLFPDEVRVVTLGIAVPAGIPAGERRIAIQVRELTPPEESSIDAVVLVVPEAPALQVRADPAAVHAGRTGRFAILVDNTGNTTARGAFAAVDAERRTKVTFTPPTLELAPGEHTVVDLKVSARQPFLGSPAVRVLDLHLDDPDAPPPPTVVPAPSPTSHKRRRRWRATPEQKPVLAERETAPLANATFVQKPVIGRGSISLVGLLAAMTVFAIVITIALSRLVGQSTADRNLALEIASARDAASTSSGTSSVAGTVRLLTSGNGVGSIGVSIYAASDPATPVATTSTNKAGAYAIGQLAAGDYKLTFRGAGFSQLWYPQAIDAADAETLTLEPNTAQRNLNVSLGGVPATLSGTVSGADVSGATLTLRTADASEAAASSASTPTGTTTGAVTGTGSGSIAPALALKPAATSGRIQPAADSTASPVPATPAGAVVKTVPIASDGTFELTGIPSPSVYQIDLTKDGYATSTQLIDIGAGEDRSGLNLTLLKGDGVISGTVTAQGKALENATLTATSGQTSVGTATLDANSGKPGTFTLRGLPTPASFTISVTKDGYVTQTLAVQLASAQTLTGVAINLDSASGGLRGSVRISGGGAAGGVAVTVTDGTDTIQTSTRSSGKIGAWSVSGLAVPGTYTVTLSRSDLASYTVSVSLDASGTITPASQGNGVTATSIATAMRSATGVLRGTVKQATSGSSVTLGEATVTVTSGTSTYTVTTASEPRSARGTYRLAGLSPGTYSVSVSSVGVRPVSTTLTLGTGSTTYSPTLQRAASVSGTVYRSPCSAGQTSCQAVGAGWVVELYRSADYPSTVYKTAVTTAGGAFSFTELDAPQSYLLQARPDAGSAAAGTTTIVLDGSEQLANVRLVVTQ